MNRFLPYLLVLFLLPAARVFAQSNADRIKLAKEYELAGEFEKAAPIYKDLYEDNPGSNSYYRMYYNILLTLQEYKDIDKLLNKQIKRDPENLTYYIDWGISLRRQGNEAGAVEKFREALDAAGRSRTQYIQLANAFLTIDETDLAIETYEKGKKQVKDYSFNSELANLYYRTGEYRRSMELYIDFAQEDPGRINSVTNGLQRMLDTEANHALLQEILYARIQQKDDPLLVEILVWDFIQQKDFASAFLQVKALDKRLRENGERVYDLGETARAEKDYDAAISCYQYVIDKGEQSPYYYMSRNGVLNCRRTKIFETNVYTREDLLALKQDYLQFLSDYNRSDYRSAFVTSELAQLEAFYLYDVDQAIERLEPVVQWQRLLPAQASELKLVLGDLYLISGDVWEATLTYSQVDKAMKDEPLGEEARFRNAKLAYYRGDFALAQGQLNVLKSATSELVANDALKLSVFITENLGLDSVAEPMELFAAAELMFFQNRNNDALAVLKSLEEAYPGHELLDDNYYLRFRIAMKEQNPEQAAEYLENIRQNLAYGLLADDAVFALGELYEEQLNKPEEAKLCYEQIILQYTDSVYVTEARKRYRRLRGDANPG